MTAPTIPITEAAFVPQKHNFSQIFDHAPFFGLEKIPKHHCNGRSVIHDGKPVFEEKVNVMGGPKTDFLLKHGLGERSSPQEWFNAFLPLCYYDGTSSNPNHPKASCWSHQCGQLFEHEVCNSWCWGPQWYLPRVHSLQL